MTNSTFDCHNTTNKTPYERYESRPLPPVIENKQTRERERQTETETEAPVLKATT